MPAKKVHTATSSRRAPAAKPVVPSGFYFLNNKQGDFDFNAFVSKKHAEGTKGLTNLTIEQLKECIVKAEWDIDFWRNRRTLRGYWESSNDPTSPHPWSEEYKKLMKTNTRRFDDEALENHEEALKEERKNIQDNRVNGRIDEITSYVPATPREEREDEDEDEDDGGQGGAGPAPRRRRAQADKSSESEDEVQGGVAGSSDEDYSANPYGKGSSWRNNASGKLARGGKMNRGGKQPAGGGRRMGGSIDEAPPPAKSRKPRHDAKAEHVVRHKFDENRAVFVVFDERSKEWIYFSVDADMPARIELAKGVPCNISFEEVAKHLVMEDVVGIFGPDGIANDGLEYYQMSLNGEVIETIQPSDVLGELKEAVVPKMALEKKAESVLYTLRIKGEQSNHDKVKTVTGFFFSPANLAQYQADRKAERLLQQKVRMLKSRIANNKFPTPDERESYLTEYELVKHVFPEKDFKEILQKQFDFAKSSGSFTSGKTTGEDSEDYVKRLRFYMKILGSFTEQDLKEHIKRINELVPFFNLLKNARALKDAAAYEKEHGKGSIQKEFFRDGDRFAEMWKVLDGNYTVLSTTQELGEKLGQELAEEQIKKFKADNPAPAPGPAPKADEQELTLVDRIMRMPTSEQIMRECRQAMQEHENSFGEEKSPYMFWDDLLNFIDVGTWPLYMRTTARPASDDPADVTAHKEAVIAIETQKKHWEEARNIYKKRRDELMKDAVSVVDLLSGAPFTDRRPRPKGFELKAETPVGILLDQQGNLTAIGKALHDWIFKSQPAAKRIATFEVIISCELDEAAEKMMQLFRDTGCITEEMLRTSDTERQARNEKRAAEGKEPEACADLLGCTARTVMAYIFVEGKHTLAKDEDKDKGYTLEAVCKSTGWEMYQILIQPKDSSKTEFIDLASDRQIVPLTEQECNAFVEAVYLHAAPIGMEKDQKYSDALVEKIIETAKLVRKTTLGPVQMNWDAIAKLDYTLVRTHGATEFRNVQDRPASDAEKKVSIMASMRNNFRSEVRTALSRTNDLPDAMQPPSAPTSAGATGKRSAREQSPAPPPPSAGATGKRSARELSPAPPPANPPRSKARTSDSVQAIPRTMLASPSPEPEDTGRVVRAGSVGPRGRSRAGSRAPSREPERSPSVSIVGEGGRPIRHKTPIERHRANTPTGHGMRAHKAK